MKKVLFVCTGNTCRSPMAQGIFNKLAEERGIDVVAESAGLNTVPNCLASENAIKVCKEIGIDISNHRTKRFSDCNVEDYVTLCTMTFEHADAIIALGVPCNKIRVMSGTDHGVPDPYGCGIGIYRSSRDVIKRNIEKYFDTHKDKFDSVNED
jgi:protein-tyrosine-phosphatase